MQRRQTAKNIWFLHVFNYSARLALDQKLGVRGVRSEWLNFLKEVNCPTASHKPSSDWRRISVLRLICFGIGQGKPVVRDLCFFSLASCSWLLKSELLTEVFHCDCQSVSLWSDFEGESHQLLWLKCLHSSLFCKCLWVYISQSLVWVPSIRR